MKKEIQSHWQTWIFLLTLGIVFIVFYKALDSIVYLFAWVKNLFSILSPFFAGLLIAYLLYIPEHKIERGLKRNKSKIIRRFSRTISIVITYILAALFIFILLKVIFPVLIESVNEFIGNVQNYYSKIINTYNDLPDDSIFKTEQVYNALKEIQNFDLKQYLSVEKLNGYIKGAVSATRWIFNIFVSIIVSVYILSGRKELLKGIKRFAKATLKENTYNQISNYFYKSNAIFFKFISSQLIDAILVGLLSTIALSILKVKYAPLLGFTIGLFNMIPYFGAIIAISIAALITFVTGGLSKAIIMLIVIIILQQIDANIINPKIIGESLKISPLIVIIAVTLGGAYFGILGMFLAVPIAAVIKIILDDFIEYRNTIKLEKNN